MIFDLDFTLIDNSFTICKAFYFALDSFQVPLPPQERILAKIGIPLKEMFLEYLSAADAEKAKNLFREYYKTHYYEGVKFIPGALEVLEKLKGLGYFLAILTSKKTEYAKKLLEYLQLNKYFSYILGEQEDMAPKPNPAQLKYIISKFPTMERVFMIGDHLVDCLAARFAGIPFIGVLTGNTTEQELRKCAGPSAFLLKSIADLDPSQHLI